MEEPIRKYHNFFPKMFKTFSLYIVITLSVFFGYVQIFGDLKPNIISLPTDGAIAEDDSFFANFIEKIAEIQNIDTNFNLAFESSEMSLSVQGNFVFSKSVQGQTISAQESVPGSAGMILDVDLIYNQQSFDVVATYIDSGLFVTINGSSYKFNTSGEMDFQQIIDIILNYINIDTSFIDSFGEFLGIDLRNFDINNILSLLSVEEKQTASGYEFVVSLGKSISAQIVCDNQFNILSVKMKDFLVANNSIKFSANVNKMNSSDVFVEYEESGHEIDMSGTARYLTYAENLFGNQYIVADIVLNLGGTEYCGKVYYDGSENPKIRIETSYEGLDVAVSYANEKIFIDVSGLKFSFSIEDFGKWNETISQIVEKHTSKSISDFLNELIGKYVDIDIKNFELEQELLNLLYGGLENFDSLTKYLPSTTKLEENSFVMIWDNGLQIKLFAFDNMLTGAAVVYGDFRFDAGFVIAGAGFDIDGDYFDLTNLLPLANIADQILGTEQFGGSIDFVYGDDLISAEYIVDFSEGVLAKISLAVLGENVEVYINNRQILLCVGAIVIEGSLDDIAGLIARIDQIFGSNLSENLNQTTQILTDISKLFENIAKILKEIRLDSQEEKILLVEYLLNFAHISVDSGKVFGHFENGSMTVDFDIVATSENISIPTATDNAEEVLNKIENVKTFFESKQYAFEFVINYFDTQLCGSMQIDLVDEVFEITGLRVGGNVLNVRYQDSVAYIEYAGLKFMIYAENAEVLSNIVSQIISANGFEFNFDLIKILTEIFGEDVSKFSFKEIFNLIEIDLEGSLSNLILTAEFNSSKIVSSNVAIYFANDVLSSIDVSMTNGFGFALNFIQFDLTEINADEYYNLTSVHKGSAILTYNHEDILIEVEIQIEIDLTDKIYIKVSTTNLNENFEIIILNNKLFVTIGEIVLSADFDNAKELFDYIIELFEIVLPEVPMAQIDELLKNLDFNGFDVLGVEGLLLEMSGGEFRAFYSIDSKLSLQVDLRDKQNAVEIVIPDNSEDLKSVLPKIKNLIAYVEKGIFEFDFSAAYNGLEFVGAFKYFKGNFEISNMIVCGENVNIRLQDGVLYLSYGNMKLKFDTQNMAASEMNLTEIINKLTSENLGIEIDFGVFEELLDMLQNYTLQDYLEKIVLDFGGKTENITMTVSNKKQFSVTQILKAVFGFVNDDLDSVEIEVFDVVYANLKIRKTDVSTISEFVASDYNDYSTNFVDVMLDSMKVGVGTYAFSSDIAIRYSTSNFYGQLVGLLVEKENLNGTIGYTPAVSVYTTALGLSTYIYIIGNNVYVDINGLQFSADLTETTINEILAFVEQTFGVSVGATQNLEQTLEMFNVILPAIDQIYGSWVTGTENGLQIDIAGDLWYSSSSKFYDIVVQAFVKTNQKMIVPTKIVVGANIQDPNTVVYDNYSEFWLKNGNSVIEDSITQNLNFAIYLNNIKVGKNVVDLGKTFLGDESGYKNIVAVKTNSGLLNLLEFNSYKTLLSAVETVYDYAMGYDYGITLNGSINTETSSIAINNSRLSIELSDLPEGTESQTGFEWLEGKAMKFEGEFNFSVDDASSYMIDLMYESNSSHAIYLTYAIAANNKFMTKINDSSLNDIITLLMKFIGKDSEDLSELTNADKILGSVTDMIEMLKGLKLSTYQNAQSQKVVSLQVKVDIEGKGNIGTVELLLTEIEGKFKLTQIKIINVEISGMIVNLVVDINSHSNSFDYFAKNQESKHIDLSGANELLSALVNTSELKYYEVNGSMNINGNLIGVDISWNVPINIKVKIDENGKPEVIAKIGAIPVVPAVNNDVPYVFGDTVSGIYCGLNRVLTMYYKDGYIYFYRREEVPVFLSANRVYEKKLKVSIGDVLNDPLKYLQYGLGFTDTIIEAIQASLDLSKGHTANLGNVVNSFTATNSTNFKLVLNMREITNDPKMDTMSIGLQVINNAETGNKNYIGKATFNMYMPLADVFKLTLDSNDLTLINIGKTLDFTALYNYVNSYTYNEGAEWEASKGSWKLSSEVIYNLSFETNSDKFISTISQAPSTNIALPHLETIVSDDGEKITTKVFAGWYTTATFDAGTQFTSAAMPRQDTKLYAKWNVSYQYYRTIKFETDCETIFDDIKKLEGSLVTIPTLSTKQVTEGDITTNYSFGGWYTSSDFAEWSKFDSTFMPNQSITLYAKWDFVNSEQTKTLNVYDNGALIYTRRIKTGDEISLSECSKIFDTTRFYIDASYTQEISDLIMPDDNLSLHIRNIYTVTVWSQYGNAGTIVYTLYQGEELNLPAQSTYVYDDGNVRTTYTFTGYTENIFAMPNADKSITANWSVDTKNYYTISFDLRWYLVLGCTAGAVMSQTPSAIPAIRVLEGTVIDLTQAPYQPTCKAYLTAIKIDAKNFKGTSWGTSAWDNYTSGGSGFTSYTVTKNQTLYVCWARA